MEFRENNLSEKLAIIGMDAHLGGWDGLEALISGIHSGKSQGEWNEATGRWVARVRGNAREHAQAEILGEAERLSPAGRMMLKTAVRALQNTGYRPGEDPPGSVAVVILAGIDEPVAASISAYFDFTAPAMDLHADEYTLPKALQVVSALLGSGQADAVLIGAVDLSGGQAGTTVSHVTEKSPTLSYDREMDVPFDGDGAAAIVVGLAAEIPAGKEYATIAAMGTATADDAPTEATVQAAVKTACSQAGILPARIGYVEVAARGEETDTAEIRGLHAAFAAAGTTQFCALGSISSAVGEMRNAGALVGLIQAALCVDHRFFPPVPGWHGPKDEDLWENGPFYVPTEARPWFVKADEGTRYAGLNVISPDGSCSHLILSKDEANDLRANPILGDQELRLFLLAGVDPDELLAQLDGLQNEISPNADLAERSRACYRRLPTDGENRSILALIAGQPEDLLREIDFARKGVPKAAEKGTEWQTPLGSYYTPQPLGKLGSVAFVYPGAFNSFIGLGKDLFQLFPQIYPGFAGLTGDMGQVIQERMLYPRRVSAPSKEEADALEAQLNENSIAMLTSGTSLAVLFTGVLREVFRVRPGAAFGYSLGESSMLYALGAWTSGDEGSTGLANSPVFRSRLSGPKDAVRDFWGLPRATNPADNGIWSNVLLMAPVEKVREALEAEDRVYLTHVNTPRQVVIAGDPASCQRVIGRMQCPSLQAPFDHVLHCPPVLSEFEELVRLHTHPTRKVDGVRLYSAAAYAPIELEAQGIARDIAETLCTDLDFPRLTNRVYEDGARIFVELGAGSNCSKWIGEILKGKPHLSTAINRKGADDFSSILRVIARFASHQAPMDLSALYGSHN